MKRILLTEHNFDPETPIRLNKAGFEVFIPKQEIPNVHEFDRTALVETIKNVQPDVLLTGFKFQIDEEILSLAPIKAVFTRTTNITDHIDYEYCKEKGVEIINLKGEDLEDVTAVAEACLGAMIQLSRLDSPGNEIRGKTLGLWGYGRIARHLEKYAKVHEMEVIHFDPKYFQTSFLLEKLLKYSDYISIHISSTPDNKGAVNYSHFKYMEKKPYLLNSARHWITEDVKKALDEGLIKGYWTDLPIEFSHPRAIVWKHSGVTKESALKTESIVVNNILKWQQKS